MRYETFFIIIEQKVFGKTQWLIIGVWKYIGGIQIKLGVKKKKNPNRCHFSNKLTTLHISLL